MHVCIVVMFICFFVVCFCIMSVVRLVESEFHIKFLCPKITWKVSIIIMRCYTIRDHEDFLCMYIHHIVKMIDKIIMVTCVYV
jgi:hypothetical protein